MTSIIISFFVIALVVLYIRDIQKYRHVTSLVQDCINVDAINDATKCLKLIPFYKLGEPMSQWLQAQIHFHNGQYVIAMTKLQDILLRRKYELGVSKINTMKLLIETYNKTNMFKEAYELLKATLKLNPKDCYLNKELGKYYFYKDDYSSARHYLTTAVETGTNDFTTFFLLAKIEYDKGAFVNALSYVERSIELNKNNIDALMLYAILKFDAKSYIIASKIFERLMIDEKYANIAPMYKAICQFHLNNFENAKSLTKQIIEFSEIDDIPIYITLLKTYVDALIVNKNILEIIPLLDNILNIDADDVFANNYQTVFKYIFKYPNFLLDFITMDRILLKDKLSKFLTNLSYDITETLVTDEEEYYFYAYPKDFHNNNILFIFSRGGHYVKLNSLQNYIYTAKNKKVASLYVATPFYFSDECFDVTDNKLTIKLHDGATFYRVLNNEIQI